ncbi:hypothetical protein ACFL3H_07040 [Gemmatimonadota bacterium]
MRGVVRPLRGLVDDLIEVKSLVEEILDAMIAHGDILEQHDVEIPQGLGDRSAALLYAAPPTFVARESGVVTILGIASDQVSALPEDIETRLEYVNHLRRLSPLPDEDLNADLVHLGLIEISHKRWIKAPTVESPDQHVWRYDRLLDSAQPSRDIPGLIILDPERPVQYYNGRWVEPRSHSGRFVARRSQAYGAPIWCYVQLSDGNPEYLIDLPIIGSRWRGCDQAWHLQMAIDENRREPQRFRIRQGPEDTRVMEFFSPVPMWAQRRWDAIAEYIKGSGCLFGYQFAATEFEEELRFSVEALWLEISSESA